MEPLAEGEVVLRGVVFDRFDGDRLAERVRAARMRLRREDQQIWAEQVDATRLPPDAQARPLRVRAPEGRFDAAGRTSRLFGGVEVVDAEGRMLETESVEHDAAQDRLHTEDPVRVRGPDFTLEGRGFELRGPEDQLEIGGPVRAVFTPAPRGAR